MEGVEKRVRDACLKLSGGETCKRVRLADLRENLDVVREELDRALLKMQVDGKLVLFRLDNPMDIKPRDVEAAIHICGAPRHIVYLERGV